MYEFWPWLLGLFAVGAIPVWFLMRRHGIGTRRADWGWSAVLFGWFFASVGVAVVLWAGYCSYVTFLSCQEPDNGLMCGMGLGVSVVSFLASLVPLGIGALLLRRAPRR